MNNENCTTGSEESVGRVQVMQQSVSDYQLWYSLNIKKLIMVVKPLK